MTFQHRCTATLTFNFAVLERVVANLVGLAAFLVLFLPAMSWASATTRLKTANGSGVLVSADDMFRDAEMQIIELKGHVQLIFDGQYISCDRAVVNAQKQEIEAVGNLVISSPQAYVEGDSAVLSYIDNTGIIINGFIKSGQVMFEGKVIRKTGPESYIAEQGSYTACTTCPTAWTFSGSRVRAEIGGYAYIRNSILRIANVPVLWLPYLIVPLKSERQSGLLIPSFDFTGDGGTAVGESFFWAISRSQDATITARNYSLRGLKGILNYRYLLSNSSGGELNTAYMHDRAFNEDPVFAGRTIGSHSKRWFVNYSHSYDLPDGFVQKTNLNFASDLRYNRDFAEEMGGYGDTALENRISLSKNTERTHSSVEAIYYINQLQTNPIESNRGAVHRWPSIRFGLADRPIASRGIFSGFLYNLDSEYVNFAREDYAFDDVTNAVDASTGVTRKTVDLTRKNSSPGTGAVFDPKEDVVRAGQRIDIQPGVSRPFSVGKYLDVLPTAQFRHTQYSFNVATPQDSDFNPSPYRQYVRYSISTRMRFSRIYGRATEAKPDTTDEPEIGTWRDRESDIDRTLDTYYHPPTVNDLQLWRHEVEPEVVFAGVPWLYQNRSDFLGEEVNHVPSFLQDQPISDSDFQSKRGIQFDYQDRVINRDNVTFLINNRLTRKYWENGEAKYKQIARVRLSQSFDFDENRKEGQPKFPWSDIALLIDVRLQPIETYTLIRHYPYHNRTTTSSRVRLKGESGRYVEVNVTETYNITQRVEEVDKPRSQTVGLSAGFDSKYLEFGGGLNYAPKSWSPVDFPVTSWTTTFNIKPPGKCWGIRAIRTQEVGKDVYFHVDFDYSFGGKS